MGFTRLVLKRPVTVVMVLLCLLVFGISSVLTATIEQMPDTDQPMLQVMANYSGTSPEDMDELVTQLIEDACSTLEGVESMTSTTSEGRSMVMLEYSYDQDMDEAYDDLKKAVDNIRNLPDDVEPTIREMGQNAQSNMMLTIYNPNQASLYDYVDQNIIPEIERLSTVAEVDMRGGTSTYIRVELNSDLMAQYGVTVSSISSAMDAADLTYPSGSVISGNLELSATTEMDNDTLDDLLAVPITTSGGQLVYLEDIASVYYAEESMGGISRYNGQETISVEITKQQDDTAMELSSQVKALIKTLQEEDEDLLIEIARDEADTIIDSLMDVAFTMVLAIVISMVIIFLFFGDIKASLIVGSAIPVSILATLIVMTAMGFSLNTITMSGLVLAVGMMVDNSTVTLESCFRAMDASKDTSALGYAKAALDGTNSVIMSIFGSTLTTCVVFLPMVTLNGMTGQMFGSMGYIIVIAMIASFLSAMSIVPLTYSRYKPKERENAPLTKPVEWMQKFYRRIMPFLLNHRILVMLISIVLFAGAIFFASGLDTELMTADYTGTIRVSIETRPGLQDEMAEEMVERAEAIVAAHEDVDSYMLRFNSSSGNITAYLKDDRNMSTDEIVDQWEIEMADIDNCTITVQASTSNSMMGRNRGYEAILEGTQYEELQSVSNEIVTEMIARNDVMNVHSSIENTAPVVAIKVDPVTASAEGLTAAQIGSQVKAYLDSTEIAKLTIDGNEISVKAEYPDDEYRTVPQLERMLISTSTGRSVALTDVAEVYYKDSPSSISKSDKAYQITITADYINNKDVSDAIDKEVIEPNLSGTITRGLSQRDRMMQSEFSGLYQAIAIAAFLVFVVLSAQFESPRFAFMVMTTIPFSLIGSFALLQIMGVSISMTSILGFLILIGTVVNNGILYVDTVNRYRLTMPLQEALINAGCDRIRPILMTSLTTILAMIPMASGFGSSGSTTQGLAVVDIGGLSVGVFVSLFILPVYYELINGKKQITNMDI